MVGCNVNHQHILAMTMSRGVIRCGRHTFLSLGKLMDSRYAAAAYDEL